ncbi:MAG TPA: sigma-70 family RNA polymerase sigma factor [Vicinamibacteria bacterium]
MEQSGEADRNLVVRARAGDRDAFAEIVRTYQRRVYAVAVRMTRRHEVADDITQDTFVRAYRSLESFDLERPLQPWLLRIAMNLAINYLNGAARRERPLADDGSAGALERPFRRDEPLDANPERALASEELALDLERAVERLPADQRTVFLLKVVEELRYEEIAELLGISEGTVMSRLSRARGRLKVMLAAHVRAGAPRPAGTARTGGAL